MSRTQFDPSIYFVADPDACGGRCIVDVVTEAIAGGVTMVQYRNKTSQKPVIAAEAAMLSEIVKAAGIPFLINDHADIAQAVGADGVHLGQDDMPPAEARKILGSEAIIGLTAFTTEQIGAADPQIVDYIGTGPVYPTKTDKGKPVLGPEGFKKLVEFSPLPVVGIGGITPENAQAVRDAGAAGVAMMRSVSEAENVKRAAAAF